MLAAEAKTTAQASTRRLPDLRHDHDFFMNQLARAVKALRLVPDFGNETETFIDIRQLIETVTKRLARHNEIEEKTIYRARRRQRFDSAPVSQKNSKISLGVLLEDGRTPDR